MASSWHHSRRGLIEIRKNCVSKADGSSIAQVWKIQIIACAVFALDRTRLNLPPSPKKLSIVRNFH
ncbi:hypothetical protein LguiA_022874 [Lonicera macranthoides]